MVDYVFITALVLCDETRWEISALDTSLSSQRLPPSQHLTVDIQRASSSLYSSFCPMLTVYMTPERMIQPGQGFSVVRTKVRV